MIPRVTVGPTGDGGAAVMGTKNCLQQVFVTKLRIHLFNVITDSKFKKKNSSIIKNIFDNTIV